MPRQAVQASRPPLLLHASVLHAASSALSTHCHINRPIGSKNGCPQCCGCGLSCADEELSSFGLRAAQSPPLSRHANLQHHAPQAFAALAPLVRSVEFAEAAGVTTRFDLCRQVPHSRGGAPTTHSTRCRGVLPLGSPRRAAQQPYDRLQLRSRCAML